ncbi:MAG: hypothetical protein AB7E72_20625 [Lysobacterales bacterium]
MPTRSRLLLLLSLLLATLAPPLLAQDRIEIDGQSKPAYGRLLALESGDIACYLSLRGDDGAEFQEMASFEICEGGEELIGSRLVLRYELQSVQSAECQGDPDCQLSDLVPLVVSARVADDEEGLAEGAIDSFCAPRETVVFDCRVGGKRVSVCGYGPDGDWLQYRFGKADTRAPLELTLPEGPVPASRAASGETVPFSGGGGSWLRFRNGDYSYVVYSGIGRWGVNGETLEKQGVVVERRGRVVADLPCSGPLTSELGPDWFEQTGISSDDPGFDFPE